MITLKYKRELSGHDEIIGKFNSYTIFECGDVYAYEIQYIDDKPWQMFYSIKNPNEKSGIRIYQVFFDELEYVILNGEEIWRTNK